MSELKLCPFCGGEAELTIGDFRSCVKCKNCKAVGSRFMHGIDGLNGSDEEAIKAWNQRQENAVILKLCDALDAAADELNGASICIVSCTTASTSGYEKFVDEYRTLSQQVRADLTTK